MMALLASLPTCTCSLLCILDAFQAFITVGVEMHIRVCRSVVAKARVEAFSQKVLSSRAAMADITGG